MNDMKIYKTKEYKIFKSLRGNRIPRPSHIRWLANSIANKNLLEYYPLLVNDAMQVIDGQHRLEAAKYLKIEVPYRIMTGAGLTEAQVLNQSTRPWLTADYLGSWIEQGKKDYQKLADFKDKYGFSVTHSIYLITRKFNSDTRKGAFAAFRVGEFTASDSQFEEAEILAKKLIEISAYTAEAKLIRNREFVQALLFVYGKISHEELIRQLKRAEGSGFKLERKYGTRGYMYQFEEVMNRHSKGNRKVLFEDFKAPAVG